MFMSEFSAFVKTVPLHYIYGQKLKYWPSKRGNRNIAQVDIYSLNMVSFSTVIKVRSHMERLRTMPRGKEKYRWISWWIFHWLWPITILFEDPLNMSFFQIMAILTPFLWNHGYYLARKGLVKKIFSKKK